MTQEKLRYDLVVEPKAGAFGTVSVVFFGVLYIVAVFAVLFMQFDGDFALAAAWSIASIVIPMTVGFFVSEWIHQRAGALWFVLTAAILTGALGAWAIAGADEFNERMDVFEPAAVVETDS